MRPKFLEGGRRPEFECKICMTIVKDPTACPLCDTLYCRKCVEWQVNQEKNMCKECYAGDLSKAPDRVNKILLQ